MRILTVIAGILISGCGAFCFAVYTNPFKDVAFLVGLVMVISGCCDTIAYLVSGSGKNRTTDTALVEGLVTLLFGFAVLNNQVTDLMLTMFFGTWLTLCGVTRVSQSFYVSRFRPKDWAKIMPLAAIASMLGVVMLMPKLVSAVMPLMLVGGAFVLDGLSLLVYAMFMKKLTAKTSAFEEKAKERAQARKAVKEAEREERDRLRKLSIQEREKEQERQRQERETLEAAKKQAREEERAARKEAARPATEKTMEFTPEEVAEINAAAMEAELKADDKPVEEEPQPVNAVFAAVAQESGVPLRPVWQKPTDVPSLRAERDADIEKEVEFKPLKFNAVNLEEIESRKTHVEFAKVELPEYKLRSDTETADRDAVLDEIKNTSFKTDDVEYTPISLEELVNEPLAKPYDPDEAKRFTQTLNFGWLEDE